MPATAGTLDGGYVVVSVETNVLDCLTDCSFESSMETIDRTCKNTTGAKSILPGALSATFSATGNHAEDAAAGTGFWAILALHKAKTKVTVRLGSEQTDDSYVEAEAYITSCSLNAPNTGSATTYNATFTVDGDYTIDQN